jgi:hypothetical protein
VPCRADGLADRQRDISCSGISSRVHSDCLRLSLACDIDAANSTQAALSTTGSSCDFIYNRLLQCGRVASFLPLLKLRAHRGCTLRTVPSAQHSAARRHAPESSFSGPLGSRSEVFPPCSMSTWCGLHRHSGPFCRPASAQHTVDAKAMKAHLLASLGSTLSIGTKTCHALRSATAATFGGRSHRARWRRACRPGRQWSCHRARWVCAVNQLDPWGLGKADL